MNGARCSSCLHNPGCCGWCQQARRTIGSLNAPRNCPAWQALPVPSHGNVVQPPEPGRLPNGAEYQRPLFLGKVRLFRH